MKKYSVLFFSVFLLMVGCSDAGKGVLGLGKDKDMVAKIGDKVITGDQIEQYLKGLPPQVSARYGAAQIRREIAEGFVSMEMLAWEARRRGIDKRDDVKQRIDMLIDQALAREIEEELKKGITITEEDLKKYYDEHPEKYSAQPRIDARIITVLSEPEAKTVLEKIKKGGDFAALAKQYSKDPSAKRGGELGMLRKGRLDPALDSVVFTMKEGEVSQVIKTPEGYSILKVDKISEGREKSYDRVKRSLERLVMREKMNKAVGDLKAEIRKKAEVEFNEKYFAQFKDKEGPDAKQPRPLNQKNSDMVPLPPGE